MFFKGLSLMQIVKVKYQPRRMTVLESLSYTQEEGSKLQLALGIRFNFIFYRAEWRTVLLGIVYKYIFVNESAWSTQVSLSYRKIFQDRFSYGYQYNP